MNTASPDPNLPRWSRRAFCASLAATAGARTFAIGLPAPNPWAKAPEPYRKRGDPERLRASANKGTPEAVSLEGLRWLLGGQKSSGAWESDFGPIASTSLGLLAFLGWGLTPESTEFGKTIRTAAEGLIAAGEAYKGSFTSSSLAFTPQEITAYLAAEEQNRRYMLPIQGPTQNGRLAAEAWRHALATMALAEYFILTGDKRIAPILQTAVSLIVADKAQMLLPRARTDAAIIAWQYWALRSVQSAGLTTPQADEFFKKAMAYFLKVKSKDGGYGATAQDAAFGYTGAACASVLDFTKRRSEVRSGIAYLDKKIDKKFTLASQSLEAGFWVASACALHGGSHWGDCRRALFSEIKGRQMSDGKWIGNWGAAGITAPSVMESFYPVKPSDDASVRTAFCILILESEWRYAPLGIM